MGIKEVLSTGVKGKHECPLWEKAAAGMSAAHSKTEEGCQGASPPNKGSTPARGPAPSELPEKNSNLDGHTPGSP